MFIGLIVGIVVFLVFLIIFMGIMEMDEGGFIMALIAGVLSTIMWISDGNTISIADSNTTVVEVNTTALQNVVNNFQKRIEILEKRTCECEPIQVSPPEIVDTYGTGY